MVDRGGFLPDARPRPEACGRRGLDPPPFMFAKQTERPRKRVLEQNLRAGARSFLPLEIISLSSLWTV